MEVLAPCLSNLLDRYNKTGHYFYYGNYYLTNSNLQLEILNDQLKEAKKDDNHSIIGSLKVRIRETEKFKKVIENEIIQNQNIFKTREEIMKHKEI